MKKFTYKRQFSFSNINLSWQIDNYSDINEYKAYFILCKHIFSEIYADLINVDELQEVKHSCIYILMLYPDLRLSFPSYIFIARYIVQPGIWSVKRIFRYIGYTAVLSWDTIARIATVTFIVQTIINSREISFPKLCLFPIPSIALPNTTGAVSAFCSEPQREWARATRPEQNYFVEAGGKKLTVGPTISGWIFRSSKILREITFSIVLYAISDACRDEVFLSLV